MMDVRPECVSIRVQPATVAVAGQAKAKVDLERSTSCAQACVILRRLWWRDRLAESSTKLYLAGEEGATSR